MAQLTALQVFNKVAENCGLETVSVLTSLSGINKVILNSIDDVLIGIGSGETWRPLEKPTGTITLAASTQSYSVPADYHKSDKDSFIYNEQQEVTYLDPQELDKMFVDQDKEGAPPQYVWESGSSFYIYPVPSSGIASKTIIYKYWKIPDRIDTASPSAATWFPEPFDQSVLVNMATIKAMSYMGLPEITFYSQIVYGVSGGFTGSLNEMRRTLRSPSMKRPIVKVW